MFKKTLITVLALIMLQLSARADTFTNLTTGETFEGYLTQVKKGTQTQARTAGTPRYIDPGQWKIERNFKGRNNRVISFTIQGELDLMAEATAFEQEMQTAATRGPLFILIKIDTSGGPANIAQSFADSILKIDSVNVVCYVTGERYGGAFATGSVLGIAGNKLFMRPGTAIGASSPFLTDMAFEPQPLNEYAAMGNGLKKAWMDYVSSVAKLRGRPLLLAQAMIDPEIEVVEVTENDKSFLTTPTGKTKNQKLVQTWSRKGVLLALNAEEAAQTGVSDGVALTEGDLLTALGLPADTTVIRNRSVARARTVAVRAQKKLNTVLATVDGLETKHSELSEELDLLELKIKRINDIILRESYGLAGSDPYYQTFPGVDIPEWEDTLNERDYVITDLIDITEELADKYLSALKIAQKHVDLEWQIPEFNKKIEEMNTTAEALKARQRIFYPPNMDRNRDRDRYRNDRYRDDRYQ